MKKPYSLIRTKDKKVIRMNTARDIGLFNAICAEGSAKQLLGPNKTIVLPQRLAQVTQPISYLTEKGNVIDLPADSYVAAYNTPESANIKGLYYIAPLPKQEVQKLKEKAEKLNIPFEKKSHPDLFSLPTLRISEMSFERLLLAKQARLIYKSPSPQTPLIEMIEILPQKGIDTISLVVKDTQGKNKQFSQKIYSGQILALAKRKEDNFTRLCFVMPEDCFGLIAQDRLACRHLGIKNNTMSAIRRVRRCLTKVSAHKNRERD